MAEYARVRNCVVEGGEHCLHWPVEGVYCCRCSHDTRTRADHAPERVTSPGQEET